MWQTCTYSTVQNHAALKQGISGIGILVKKPLEAAQAGRHGQGRGWESIPEAGEQEIHHLQRQSTPHGLLLAGGTWREGG